MNVGEDAPSVAFTVVSYSGRGFERAVIGAVGRQLGERPDAAKKKLQYLRDYLEEIGVKTILSELDYIDRDFLDDFAAYYVRCFSNYGRKCARLHFFSTAFSHAEFTRYLRGERGRLSDRSLQASYCGFIVVKPLPKTFIGRTCLRTYPRAGRRFFPVNRGYTANLFGTALTVAETAPFQEQDTVVAACATSALWSAFHGTARIFHNSTPTPVEITRAATERVPSESRTLPNNGLTGNMMAAAVRSVGLEPLKISPEDSFIFKSTVYAYLRMGIPCVLGIALYDMGPTKSRGRRKPDLVGLHAVTVVGYSLGKRKAVPTSRGFMSEASRMDKVYVHDDQVGPFARMVIDAHDLDTGQKGNPVKALSTNWLDKQGNAGNIAAVGLMLLIPLYHKIRISLEMTRGMIIAFDYLLGEIAQVKPGLGLSRLLWDIYLTSVNEFKEDCAADDLVVGKRREQLLISRLPRFIWRATARQGTNRKIDLLIDATDIGQGRVIRKLLCSDPALQATLTTLAMNPGIDRMVSSEILPILQYLRS